MRDTKDLTVSATFPVPKGYALCCPMGCGWKMYPYTLAMIPGYRCAGDKKLGGLPMCGKFISEIEARAFIGMRMIEE